MGGSQSSPVGGGGKGVATEAQCANGILGVGSRVQTQYTRDEGGDDRWYSGTITKVFANNRASIRYDDGDKWTGETMYIHLLQPRSGPGPSQPPMQQGVPLAGGMDGFEICTAMVPPGAMAGQSIQVAGPGGVPMQVAVPQGMHPGQSFQFKVPVAAPPVVQAVAVATPVMGEPVMGLPRV